MFISGIPALIVAVTAAARTETYDMSQDIIEEFTCGTVKFTAKVERTRHVLDVVVRKITEYNVGYDEECQDNRPSHVIANISDWYRCL